LISPTLATFDAQAECRRIFKLAFELGRKTGLEDAQTRIEIAEMQADLWYFVAHNPGALAEEKRLAASFTELWEARAETEQRLRRWDADEQLRFDQARAMLAEGMDPVEVAIHLELFLPIVENLKAGVL
jgi:hypothetical protein